MLDTVLMHSIKVNRNCHDVFMYCYVTCFFIECWILFWCIQLKWIETGTMCSHIL